MPPIKSNRYTSLGLGKRTDFAKLRKTQCEKFYDIPSEFDTSRKKTGISFGISRDHYKKVFVQNNLCIDDQNPGPAIYDVRSKMGKDAPKFSLYSKIDNQSVFSKTRRNYNNLGPGSYNYKSSINPDGRSPYSTFKNTNSFGFGKEKRFKNKSK